MTIRLIIKGPRATAEYETSRRNLGAFSFFNETAQGETVGTVSSIGNSPVIVGEWFLEDCNEKAPYKIGSLLHYSVS